MTLYMKCTTDRYEFPIAVADTGRELANMLGVSVNSVWSCISKGISGYHKIEVEDFDLYPDNDGRLYYKDPKTWNTVYVEG